MSKFNESFTLSRFKSSNETGCSNSSSKTKNINYNALICKRYVMWIPISVDCYYILR